MLNSNTGHIPKMKLSRHPVTWVAQILAPWQNGQVEMSRYQYVPQSFNDYRSTFFIPVSHINENSLLEMLITLEPDYELAMHSKVLIGSEHYHIPMIDFGSKGSSPAASETIKELCRYWNMTFSIYESGRSFHAYGDRLLTQEQWLQFMGSLLLLNKPSGYKLIDERWVGHRIMAGYSALRWSKNTSHYKRFPTHCGFVNGDNFNVSETGIAPSPPSLPTTW
ncbi:primase 1D-like protein [Vibrio cholerae]|uniref:primase 1D-like protein n=1 Tax=Vibrio cholerae TaxID=666 RepID=UPI0006E66137|nr:hypothetical protein [Vibrio cholerae]MBY7899160.1 hypothetical protein [Vibrio fluvialis]KQA15673.1 hypothetical protein XM60_02940 [Vibrio cholerae]KQA84407.1 hypothetical protein XV86_04190 [Vibrio cholerae]KQA91984.1 hypothetical protein XV88_01615 [Vibrio cholerae]PAR75463.1 hypothetical protein CGT86_16170 [Vibrio cholerae]